jgi:methylated-DNA-[protein]-cysteine S-methyltransferase
LKRVYYDGIPSPIGTIWAAATEAGLFNVHMSTSKAAFMSELKRRIDAKVIHAPHKLDALRSKLDDYFHGEPVVFDLSLDLRGTDFQRAIWREIHKIPYGKLSSYGRLAAAVGKPKAMRAAGNATGANPIGLVIPCHRVVRSDGSLGGFGNRIDLKEYLLSLEGVLPASKGEDSDTRKGRYKNRRLDLRPYFYK